MPINFQNLFFRLSVKDKMLFARDLEMMTRSGMQLLASLEILRKQAKTRSFAKVLDQLIVDVRNGHFLSVGLARYRNVFGDFFINLIRVGESTGTLSQNLGYLAEEMGKKDALQKKVRGALIYPLIILGATAGITGILTFVIFPKILPVLTSLRVDLPLTTVVFIAVSHFMLNYGLYVFIGLVVLTFAWLFLLRLPGVRYFAHRVILSLPVAGTMAQNVNLISFGRTMSLLLKAGVQIVEALNITADTLTNLVYKNEIRAVARIVQAGDPVSKCLIDHPKLFPATFAEMITVGETTGKLDETLSYLAGFYESELDESTKAMSNVLEPVLLLVMGLVVGFVALAIITPIYKITQTLGR